MICANFFLFVLFSFPSGLGVSMLVISAMVCIYYNMILGYTIFYLFASMKKEVPWQRCKPEWKALGCLDRILSDEERLVRNLTSKEIYHNNSTFNVAEMISVGSNC